MVERKDYPSFSKSLFSGLILDELVFPYPEQDKENSENLEIILATLRKFANDYIDADQFDQESTIR